MAVTQYTEKFEPDGSAGTILKAVNSTAITDINANNELIFMLLYENDFISDGTKLYTPDTTGGFFNTDGGTVRSMEYSTASLRPLLTVTYSDATIETHSADSSGDFDDTWYRTTACNSEAAILAGRNAEDANFQFDAGAGFTLGNYKFGVSAYNARCSMRFATNASKTALSATLRLGFSADVTSGFGRASWQGRGVYVCKMSSDVSTSFGTEDWSHLQGWVSSGSYAITEEEAIVYNANFFGTNF